MNPAPHRRRAFELLANVTAGRASGPVQDWQSEALWRRVLPLAELHRVTTALPGALKELGAWRSVPNEIAIFLEAAEELNLERNRALMAQYLQIRSVLAQAGINALPLKGTAYQLLGLHCDAPGRRMTIDIDVLVPLKDAARAQNILISTGYKPLTNSEPNELEHHNFPRLKPDPKQHGPGSVEVHFRVGRHETDELLPAQRVFASAQALQVSGESVLVPNHLDLLDHAVLHSGIAHSYASRRRLRLRDAEDISRLWTAVQNLGITVTDLRICKHGLASRYFGACLLLYGHPIEALGPLGPSAAKMLERIMRRQAISERPKLETAILSNARLLVRNPSKLAAKFLRGSFYQSARAMAKSPTV